MIRGALIGGSSDRSAGRNAPTTRTLRGIDDHCACRIAPKRQLFNGLLVSCLTRARAWIFFRICRGVFVQSNGLASSFQASRYLRIARSRCGTLSKLPRRITCVVTSANQRSTKFSQDALVGAKWN